MLGEGIGQRGAAPHASQHVGHQGAEVRVRGQLGLDAEHAIERQARLEERRDLLGERDQIAAGDATPAPFRPGQPQEAPP